MRRAFTLVELLVVVGIIALLLTLLMPNLSRVNDLARATNCASQLGQIGRAFHAPDVHQALAGQTRYPPHSYWPSIPLNVGLPSEIFICPDETEAFADAGTLQFRSQEGWFASFEAGTHCAVTEGNGYTDYAFEDLWNGDFDMDAVHVRIYHGAPERLVIEKMGTAGYTDNAIFYRGEQLISDSSHSTGEGFVLNGGLTNYGINAQVARVEVAPRTVVLLDYDMQAANNGEDQTVHLQASRRHLGKLNVLFADESVRRMGAAELDPGVSTDAADLWSPE